MTSKVTIPRERIQRCIYLLRGEKVMLDAELAALYGVETGALKRAVNRNASRFPPDFMFMLWPEEAASLRCQTGISSQIMAPPAPDQPAREIGFHVREEAAPYRTRRLTRGPSSRPPGRVKPNVRGRPAA